MAEPDSPSTSTAVPDALPAESPDAFEAVGHALDDIVPTSGYQMAPMVGLGGSAGSLVALQQFFQAMPADSGLVFIVVLHLSPVHESSMAQLLGRVTSMQVVQAEDGQKVEPNHVYVIPPASTWSRPTDISSSPISTTKKASVSLSISSFAP